MATRVNLHVLSPVGLLFPSSISLHFSVSVFRYPLVSNLIYSLVWLFCFDGYGDYN